MTSEGKCPARGSDGAFTKEWVRQQLHCLSRLPLPSPEWMLFEPSDDFYRGLEFAGDEELTAAGEEIGQHVGLVLTPVFTFEWSLRFSPGVHGQIQYQANDRSIIRIPIHCAGKAHALGGILAHELAHEYMRCNRIGCPTEQETENLTDLCAIYLGLGKLLLNGTIVLVELIPECDVLGYLTPELKAYAYLEVNRSRGIAPGQTTRHLNSQARALVIGAAEPSNSQRGEEGNAPGSDIAR